MPPAGDVTRPPKEWDEFYRGQHAFGDLLRWGLTHAQLVSEVVGAGGRALEIGVGSGMLSTLVSRFVPAVVTIDNNPAVLARARAFAQSASGAVTSVRGDAFSLPFAADSFAACFSQGLFEHFSDEQVRAMVGEQLRVAPAAFCSIPSWFYPHIGRRGPGLIGNERLLTRARWERILTGWRVQSRYYPDYKIASFAGWTLPWPAHVLICIRRA